MPSHKPTCCEKCKDQCLIGGGMRDQKRLCECHRPTEGCCEKCKAGRYNHFGGNGCIDKNCSCHKKPCHKCGLAGTKHQSFCPYRIPHQDWREEFDRADFTIGDDDYGVDVRKIKSFISQVEKKAKQDTLAEVIERVRERIGDTKIKDDLDLGYVVALRDSERDLQTLLASLRDKGV